MGTRLRQQRIAAGVGVKQLAYACSYSHTQISRLERELRPPPPPGHRLYRGIAQLLGAPAARALELAAQRERVRTIAAGVSWRNRSAR